MRAINGSWAGVVRGEKVRWSARTKEWTVGGRKLPKKGGYDPRDWETAVIAWQQAVCTSFKELNKEVQQLKKIR